MSAVQIVSLIVIVVDVVIDRLLGLLFFNQRVNIPMSDQALEKLVTILDLDGDGEIDFS